MRIGVMGSKYHSNLLLKVLDYAGINGIKLPLIFEGVTSFIGGLKNVDMVHVVLPPVNVLWIPTLLLLKALKKKVVVHWIGSDVLKATDNRKTKTVAYLSSPLIDLHLAGATWLRDELKEIGISSIYVPLVSDIDMEVSPLPESFTALVFLPETRYVFYGGPTIEKLAKEFPTIRFLVVGNNRNFREPNIKSLGWIADMKSIYKKSSVLLRIPRHDGLSLMVLEALSAGRQVIYSCIFPFCDHARKYIEVKEALSMLLKNLTVNYEGAKYVKSHFNNKKLTKSLLTIYSSLL